MIPNFRVLDEETKTIFDVKGINYNLKVVYGLNTEYIEYNQKMFPFKDYPIMQSTGLLDKTGKEIFEGDVVEILKYHDLYDNLLESPIKFTGLVDFDEGQWKIISKKGRLSLFSKDTEIEVVGNKYMGEYKEFLNENE